MALIWFSVGVLAWVMATFGPSFLYAWFSRLLNGTKQKWRLHLMFAPALFVIEWVSSDLLLFAAGDTEGRGLGLLLLPALLVFLLILVAYYAQAVAPAIAHLHRMPRSNFHSNEQACELDFN